MSIRLVLADSHPLMLKGMEQLFSTEPDFAVLAYCSNGEQAVRAVRRHRPDILTLDLKMPVKDGLEVLRELRSEQFPVRAVLLTAALDKSEALDAIRLGVRGIVLKEMAPELLIQCLRKVHAGEEWLEKRSVGLVMDKLLRDEARKQEAAGLLTPREMELVRQVACGFSNREIAGRLHISEGTVKVHLHRIYEKLAVKSRVGLTLYAQERELA